MKKVLLKKFLVCILIVVIAGGFIFNHFNVVYASDDVFSSVGHGFSNIVTGLIGLILWVPHLMIAAPIIGIMDIIGAIAKIGLTNVHLTSVFNQGTILTPFDILFNRVPLVDINFFDLSASGTIGQFRDAVAGWYYTMRLIASMILLIILIYIGIRMALTSIATEKAMYKKMLVDWVTSLALLFLLHYIMLFIFTCNNVLVDAMAQIAGSTNIMDQIMIDLELLCFDWDVVTRVIATAIFGMMVFQTLSFLIAYIKRMLTIGFLIIIAPLITITYSIDKIGDGKSQALNTWLKEFAYNILIQPFQCILYMVFAKLSFDLMLDAANKYPFQNLTKDNVGPAIFALLCLWFVKEGEKIVKKIFGFGKASTAGDLAVGAAMTAGALFKGANVAMKAGGAVSRGKNAISTSKAATTLREYNNARKDANSIKKASKIAEKASKVAEKSEKRDEKRAEKIARSMQSKEGNQKFTSSGKKLSSIDPKTMEAARKQVADEKAKKANEIAQKAAAKSQKVADKAEKKKIKKASGKPSLGGALKKASGEAIGGIYNTIKDNQESIKGAAFGVLLAGAGLAAGDFGDVSKALAGYGMGKGFMEGYYANSSNDLREESGEAAQLIANLTGVEDINDILANAQVEGANELSKTIKEALKDLKSTLKKFENRDRMIGSFANTALDKKTAGTITREGISQMLDENGFDGTDEEKQKAIDSFANYGRLIATQTLYNNIQNAEGMDIDREALASILGNKKARGMGYSNQSTGSGSSIGGTTNTTVTNETIENYEDYTAYELGNAISGKIENSSNNITVTNLEETQRKIDDLNSLISALQKTGEKDRAQIIHQISENNQNIASYNDVMNELNVQLSALEAKKSEFQG